MRKIITFIVAASLTGGSSAIELSKHISTIIEPTPLKRVHPRYPISAAKSGREGWARLSFVIEIDGSVSNVLVDETSGSTAFGKAAKSAVLKWKYEPAFEDGKPIQQCINSVEMNFVMKNRAEKGVTRRFMSKFRKTQEALKNKEYDTVKMLLSEFSALKNRHLSENNYFHLLGANYAKEVGDNELQLFYLRRIALQSEMLTPPDYQLTVLEQRFTLEVNLNLFRQAQATYNKLSMLKAAKPYMPQFDVIMAKVDAFVGGKDDFAVSGKLNDSVFWQHGLVRNKFSLTDIEGSIHKLDVRCSNKRHQYTVEKNNTWTLPEAWKSCSVYVYGDDNSTFNLVEHSI